MSKVASSPHSSPSRARCVYKMTRIRKTAILGGSVADHAENRVYVWWREPALRVCKDQGRERRMITSKGTRHRGMRNSRVGNNEECPNETLTVKTGDTVNPKSSTTVQSCHPYNKWAGRSPGIYYKGGFIIRVDLL
eukprot:5016622-Pyramimonas_sp.AAC.1